MPGGRLKSRSCRQLLMQSLTQATHIVLLCLNYCFCKEEQSNTKEGKRGMTTRVEHSPPGLGFSSSSTRITRSTRSMHDRTQTGCRSCE